MDSNEASAGTCTPPSGRNELLRLAFARLHKMVYATALRVTGQPADAEDIVQEVFVILHEQREQLQTTSLPGWLKRTTLLIAMNHVRKRGRRAARLRWLADWANSASPGASDPTPITALTVRSLLGRIPDDLRVPLIARYQIGFTLDEIAQMLDVSTAAAGRRVHKAADQVRRLVEGDQKCPEKLNPKW